MSLPNLNSFKGSVDAKDVVVGAAVGLAGSAGIRYALNQYGLMSRVPTFAVRFLPSLTGIVAGAALFVAQKGSARAKAHLVGSVTAGIAVNLWQEIQSQFPALQDYVSLNMPMSGMLINDPRLQGMLVDDSARNLAEVQSVNLQDDGESATY
jgi:hypothetical protein